ncbi:alcohol dehydrogenase [Streptomyces sp. Act143]|uniref:aldo/keto reductase n=1 Tax=Streptomyces sp. Act143 TaxID=2200760 RepID=UPI000D68098A|nr:aldo/keto reductase [Streptomyces sp. Act143]PWI19393.1 alcohol dehydrogenase [Streptomyces sp. Act143]
MKYVKLGRTGLDISPICLGCMTFGEPERGYPSWSMPEDDSRAILKQAIDAGINFFDTANVYSDGSSEEILGRALRDFARRDEVVIATKVRGAMRPGPNGSGLSRKAIFTELDASLTRLGTDHIDLYQIHRLDHAVPMEETLEALHDVVKSGKVRYIGASSMHAWEFSKALHLQQANGWARFVSMQDHYNLLNREEEREMLPLCADQGIGVIPWSPLGRGRLTRDWDTVTDRSSADPIGNRLYDATEAADKAVVEKVASIAAARGVSRAQVALAWLLRNPVISAPIVGAGKPAHLDDALAALELGLTDEEVAELETPYVPHPVVGIA